jgi:Gpi18-like mannosyltransferase
VRSTLKAVSGLPDEAPLDSPERPATTLPWRAVVLDAAGVWLASRVILILASSFTLVLNSHDSVRQRSLILGSRSAYDLIASWYHWDAEWYLPISQSGYFNQQSAAFFPLYPLLVNLLSTATAHISQLGAALALSHLASLAGFIGIGLLAASEGGRAAAGKAMLVAAAYPLAFFLAAPYTEALFLAGAAFTLFFARRGQWGLAAGVAFLAGLTRPTAVILVLPMALEFIRQRAWSGARTRLAAAVLAVSAVPAAFACYAVFLWFRFGQPLLFLQVQAVYWKRRALPPWETVALVVAHLSINPLLGQWGTLLVLDLGAVILFAALTVYGVGKQPLAFTAYMVGLLVLCVDAPLLSNPNPLSSSARFLVAAVPGFLLLGRLVPRQPWLETLIVGGGFMLQAVFLTLFLSGPWLG